MQTVSPLMTDMHDPATPTITQPTAYNPENRYTPGGTWEASSNATIEVSNKEQTLTGANIDGLVSVFPQWLVRAIRKGQDVAVGVTMVFPALPNGKVQCLMSLAISPDKVQRLASVLFDIHLEIEGGFRFVVYNDTVRISPRPEINLQGATGKAIIECLGCEIHRAIEASPARSEERRNGILATNCVTMVVTGDPSEESILNLCLGLKEAYQIKETLYG